VTVQSIPAGSSTPAHDIPVGRSVAPAVWLSPRTAPPQPLLVTRQFQVYSNVSQTYVPATGRLAYTGQHYAYYEDITNNSNFSHDQYRTIDSIASANVPRLDALMGLPTDLDGNSHIIVFISETASAQRIGGQAYVDGCNMNTGGGNCGDLGEIIYIVPPNHFGSSWSNNAAFYVNNYYPRNILHEYIHLLQHGHSYRRTGNFSSWTAPAMIYEGLAELSRIESRLGFQDAWDRLRTSFSSRDFSKTPFTDPYYAGAVLNWWLLRSWGDGYPQAMIDAMFSAIPSGQDLFESAVGIREPVLLTIYYASLFFDSTPFGSQFNLQFPGESVPSLLSGANLPTDLLPPGNSLTIPSSYTGVRVLEIRHTNMVRIMIETGNNGAAVLIAQP
jgi:hypothetical protein